jgi:hypothetical protein
MNDYIAYHLGLSVPIAFADTSIKTQGICQGLAIDPFNQKKA